MQKFRNQRIRCTFHNNMGTSKGQCVFEPTSCTNRQCTSSRSLRRPHGTGTLKQVQGGKNTAWSVAQVQDSSVLTFVPKSCSSHDHERSTFRLKRCHEVFVWRYWSRENHVLRRPQAHRHDNQNYFHASHQKSFPQDTNHCCATADKSVGIVTDSRMNAQCNYPGSQRFAHQPARHSHPRWHCLERARHHQEKPDNRSLWAQFVIVLVMKAPNADRTVAWSTSHDSTQTEATNNQTALGIGSSLCQNR